MDVFDKNIPTRDNYLIHMSAHGHLTQFRFYHIWEGPLVIHTDTYKVSILEYDKYFFKGN